MERIEVENKIKKMKCGISTCKKNLRNAIIVKYNDSKYFAVCPHCGAVSRGLVVEDNILLGTTKEGKESKEAKEFMEAIQREMPGSMGLLVSKKKQADSIMTLLNDGIIGHTSNGLVIHDMVHRTPLEVNHNPYAFETREPSMMFEENMSVDSIKAEAEATKPSIKIDLGEEYMICYYNDDPEIVSATTKYNLAEHIENNCDYEDISGVYKLQPVNMIVKKEVKVIIE